MSLGSIEVENLGKHFQLGRRTERYLTMRDIIANAASRAFRRRAERAPAEQIWALRNVGFHVKAGEVIGLIGRNGAGKSTLLKVLARITEPTEGSATIHGRVGSLLEVGTGFHMELSGRENTYLNGAVLGMKRKEIDRKFDEIVQFAELEKFMDTPVKHYSTGMYMRLAFGVAAHLETEILLVDEVLAVGDAIFQKKCMGKMGDLAAAGRTVLFVSHNLSAVTGLCSRALWIDKGRLVADGPVEEVTGRYISTLAGGDFRFTNTRHGLTILGVNLRNASGDLTTHFTPGDDMTVEIEYETDRPVVKPYFLVLVSSLSGFCFEANMLLDGRRPDVLQGRGRVACRFRGLPLLPQSYTVWLGVKTPDNRESIVASQEVASFSVVATGDEWNFQGELFHHLAGRAVPMVLPYDWIHNDGSVHPVSLSRGAGRDPSDVNRNAIDNAEEVKR
jgi:lipopolysaccharide transport system ATP-binding protein